MSDTHSGIPESPLRRFEYRVFVSSTGSSEAEARGHVDDFVSRANLHGCSAEIDEGEPDEVDDDEVDDDSGIPE